MAEYPALPLFTDAYMSDTRHLTPAQHGAYLLLLMTAWRMPDCKLPDDDRFLSRCASMDIRTWKQNREIVLSFWKRDEMQKWYQGRLLDERKYVDELKRKNSKAGKASALKRLNRTSTSVQPDSNETSTPTPTPTPIKPPTPKGDAGALWNIWQPYEMTKGSKKKAEEKYLRALTKTSHENLMAQAKAYCAQCARLRQKTQHVATWLHQHGWETEYASPIEKSRQEKARL
jgi:uncharacterized protein YdaU (DUF1376 family)